MLWDSKIRDAPVGPNRLLEPHVVAGVGFSAVIILGALGVVTVFDAEFLNGL